MKKIDYRGIYTKKIYLLLCACFCCICFYYGKNVFGRSQEHSVIQEMQDVAEELNDVGVVEEAKNIVADELDNSEEVLEKLDKQKNYNNIFNALKKQQLKTIQNKDKKEPRGSGVSVLAISQEDDPKKNTIGTQNEKFEAKKNLGGSGGGSSGFGSNSYSYNNGFNSDSVGGMSNMSNSNDNGWGDNSSDYGGDSWGDDELEALFKEMENW